MSYIGRARTGKLDGLAVACAHRDAADAGHRRLKMLDVAVQFGVGMLGPGDGRQPPGLGGVAQSGPAAEIGLERTVDT